MHQPKFLKKLKNILENDEYSEDIHWDQDGKSIVINIDNLTKNIIGVKFNQSDYPSFVRELTKYNFKKVNKKNDKIAIYSNENFFKGISDEEIEKIEKEIKEEKYKLNDDNIFDDENYEIDTNEERIHKLLETRLDKDNIDELKEIFYYLRKEQENSDTKKIQDDIDLLKVLKNDLLNKKE